MHHTSEDERRKHRRCLLPRRLGADHVSSRNIAKPKARVIRQSCWRSYSWGWYLLWLRLQLSNNLREAQHVAVNMCQSSFLTCILQTLRRSSTFRMSSCCDPRCSDPNGTGCRRPFGDIPQSLLKHWSVSAAQKPRARRETDVILRR